MAQLNYDEYEKLHSDSSENEGKAKTSVRYLTLADDGDSAIVRFVYHDEKHFDVNTFHTVEVDGRKIKVNCLRNPYDPVDVCPFCEAEEKISTKFFVKVIEYVKGEDGKITPEPKLWQRPTGFVKTLKQYIKEYGDLTNYLFKITRSGAKGDKDTTYTVMIAPPMYKDDVYVKDLSGFDGYKLIGRGGAIKDKTFEQMNEFLETGEFPAPTKSTKTVKEVAEEIPSEEEYPEEVVTESEDVVSEEVAEEVVEEAPAPVKEVVRPTAAPVRKTYDIGTQSSPTTPASPNRPRRYAL